MITDVAIDLDGVVFDFSRVVTAVFSKYLKTDLPTPTKWEFFDEWNMTASDFYSLLDHLTVETEFFNSESPIRHTMVGWQSLREQNLRIHVITHHMPHLETVALGIWVKAGARDERAEENGIAHFLARFPDRFSSG